MTLSPNRRHGAIAGIVSMILLLVGNFMTGQPPKFAASASTIEHFYTQHHRAILIGMILTGVAVPLYIWFIAHLALMVRGPLGASIALGGLLIAGCAATGDALMATGAQAAHTGGDPNSIRLLFQLSSITYSRLFWAGLAVAIPLAMVAASLKPWVRYVAWAQTILYLLAGISLKSGGFFSPAGGMALLGYLAFFLGTGLTAFALLQVSPSESAAHAPAATPA